MLPRYSADDILNGIPQVLSDELRDTDQAGSREDLRALARAKNDPEVVRRVSRMLDWAEYKRRQAPPGVKITSRAFGRDRRYPITNRFRYGD